MLIWVTRSSVVDSGIIASVSKIMEDFEEGKLPRSSSALTSTSSSSSLLEKHDQEEPPARREAYAAEEETGEESSECTGKVKGLDQGGSAGPPAAAANALMSCVMYTCCSTMMVRGSRVV